MSGFTKATFAATAGLAAVLVSAGLGCRDESQSENPQTYIGQTVTLSGEVERVVSDQGFRFEPDERFDEELLVLSRSPIQLGTTNLEDGQKLRVSGTVRQLVVADIERELGWDLDPELEMEFESKPILIVDSVTLADDPSVSWSAQPGVAPSPSQPRTTTPAASPPPGQGGQGGGATPGGQGGGATPGGQGGGATPGGQGGGGGY